MPITDYGVKPCPKYRAWAKKLIAEYKKEILGSKKKAKDEKPRRN